ncbi:MAG: hypothetical protein WBM12_11140 [Pseudolabrys sp.]
MGDDMHQLAVEPVHRAHMCRAETHSVTGDCIKYRLQVESGVADDFEDFGARRQLL